MAQVTRYIHLRFKDSDGRPTSRGGLTVAYLIDTELDSVIRWSAARCSSNDNFCKSTGRTISQGRLHSPRLSRTISPLAEKLFVKLMHETPVNQLFINSRPIVFIR
jgi:hypothetical protein